MGRPKGSRNRPKWTEERKLLMVQKRAESKDCKVEIKSDSFTIYSTGTGWSAEVGNDLIHYSRLDYLCICLLERKLKKAEKHSIEALRDEVQKAKREILFSVGKVYPPNIGVNDE